MGGEALKPREAIRGCSRGTGVSEEKGGDASEAIIPLIGLMWRDLSAMRETDSKVTTTLTVFIGVGSALLGAGFGGLFSY